MAKRVYRGHCPYESFFEIEFEGDCRNCEYFQKCQIKEKKRRKRAKQRRNFFLAWSVLIGGAVIVILVIVLIIGLLVNAIKGNISNENKPADTSIFAFESESKIHIDFEVDITDESELDSAEIGVQDIPTEIDTTGETQVNSLPDFMSVPSISAYEPGELYYYELSYEDKVYIAKAVYAESRGEPFEGQVAVAATILNRFTSDDSRFVRDSIYSVVTQSGQFASISGITMDDLNSVPSCMEAVEAACKGWDPTRVKFPDGAKFFFNPDGDLDEIARKEREGIETYRIGSHLFHIDLNPV